MPVEIPVAIFIQAGRLDGERNPSIVPAITSSHIRFVKANATPAAPMRPAPTISIRRRPILSA